MQYKELVSLYEQLDKTSKRLEKTYLISQFIKRADADLGILMLLIQGKIFPDWSDKKIGVADQIVVKAIAKSTGASPDKVEDEWKRLGDLGDVAEELSKKRKQSSLFPRELYVKEVFNNLRRLAEREGKGSVEGKIGLICDMLIHASPTESKYIIRTAIDNLRVGIGSGSMRDALVWAFFSKELGIIFDPATKDIKLSEKERGIYNDYLDKVQHAYDMTNDFGEVAILLKEKGIHGLETINLEPGKPVNVMLFQKAKDIKEAFEIVGRPAAFEFKYDGFRMQIHKTGGNIKIFTRRLEDVTAQFPEVAGFAAESIDADNYIIDAEAVGFNPDTKKYIPFQSISQRIKRKYDIDELGRKFPVEVNIFDILYLNGKSMLDEPFRVRRGILEKIVRQSPQKIVLSKQIVTENDATAQEFYDKSLAEGEEGMMAKNLNGPYKPGSRVGYGIKIKPVMDPLDLVIVGAEYGEGKRSGWLTSFTLACKEEEEYLEIGRVSTGLKELGEEGVSFKEMTELLKPLVKKSSGRYAEIKPGIVIEVGYEEIQKSPTYSSGYALRFPRFLRLRTDEKTPEDISTISDVEQLYAMQRARNKT